MKRLFFIIVGVIFCFNLSACGGDGYARAERNEVIFGSDLTASVEVWGRDAEIAADKAVEEMKRLNRAVSATVEGSDIFKFNAVPAGGQIEVGFYTYDNVKLAKEWNRRTGGAFNPTLRAVSEAWRVSADSPYFHNEMFTDYIQPDGLPSPGELDVLKGSLDLELGLPSVSAREENGAYYLKKEKDVTLDLGGIAKGYAADICAEVFSGFNIKSAKINISGNLYFYGKSIKKDGLGYAENDAWQCGITDPRPRASLFRDVFAAIEVGQCSAVTSGDYERYYAFDYGGAGKADDTVYIQHIIDPFTLYPAGVYYDESAGRYKNDVSAVISATVLNASSAVADIAATAACVLGWGRGIEFLERENLSAVIVDGGLNYGITGRVKQSPLNGYEIDGGRFALKYGGFSAA